MVVVVVDNRAPSRVRAREGVVEVVLVENMAPLSHIRAREGSWLWWAIGPLRLAFEQGKGWYKWQYGPSVTCSSDREVVGLWWAIGRVRAREGVVEVVLVENMAPLSPFE